MNGSVNGNRAQLFHSIKIKLIPNGSTLQKYKSDMHYLRGSALLCYGHWDIMKMATNSSVIKKGKKQKKQKPTISLNTTQILSDTHQLKHKPTKWKKKKEI